MDSLCICREREETPSLLVFYDKKKNTFRYHDDLVKASHDGLSEMSLWQYLEEREGVPPKEVEKLRVRCLHMTAEHGLAYETVMLPKRGKCVLTFICDGDTITIALRNAEDMDNGTDVVTGLPSRRKFCKDVAEILAKNGSFAVFYFDLVKFKVLNDLFGYAEGDRVLRHIAGRLQAMEQDGVLYACRASADRFVMLATLVHHEPEWIVEKLAEEIADYRIPFDMEWHVGIYLTEGGTNENVNSMIDKAILAQGTVKGRYGQRSCYYTEELREAILTEYDIESSMHIALEEGEFINYYQPQYNHSTGQLIGAEALVRWKHPEKGLIPPGVFIPIFEKTGFITQMDFYVFESVCRFLARSAKLGYAIVPVSVNFSKNDVYLPDFVDRLETIRKKYNVSSQDLRIEITESVFKGNHKVVNGILHQLHQWGYIVEMDDFGSGYSSLNMLKELDIDIIKLDMLFLEDNSENSKGGIIVSSVVNMAKWLHMPVIAEGVETVEQAEFLRSIGCEYMQGYLFSKPLPQEEYEKLVNNNTAGKIVPQLTLTGNIDNCSFWAPDSQDTLLFNQFVGGAAIFRYNRMENTVEVIRVNRKYLREIGMNMSERELLAQDADNFLTAADKKTYFDTLDTVIETMEEQECESWRQFKTSDGKEENICIRSNIHLIGRSGERFLFYATIRNITTERLWMEEHKSEGMGDKNTRPEKVLLEV